MIAGGMIFFGGGFPLYQNGQTTGGLGTSGDTSCTDHEIAKVSVLWPQWIRRADLG